MRTCTCSLIGIAQAITLGFILGCRDMCTHNENGGEVSAQDFSSDRYSYMGIYLQRGPRDVVPLVDERLQGASDGQANCWVSSHRESEAYNGEIRRYYSIKRKLPYRAVICHDFGSASPKYVRKYVDDLIYYAKMKSEDGSGPEECPVEGGMLVGKWKWKYLDWAFTMKLEKDVASEKSSLWISVDCPTLLHAAKEELRN